MKNLSCEVNLIFNEEGKSLTNILEDLCAVLLSSDEVGEFA